MKIKPFENAGGYTTFHNAILDHILPLCTSNEWKIVCITLRKTIGWQKEEDWVSLSQYQKLAGIKSRPTAHKAIQGCLSKKFITRTPYNDSFKYSLNLNYSLSVKAVQKIHQPDVINKPAAGLENEHTIDTITIDTITKDNNGAKPRTPKPKKKRDPLLDHPAIIAHKDIIRLNVPIIFREAVVNIVGDSPASLNKWKQTLRDWIGSGYNPKGIKNILDKFQGGSPKKKTKKSADRQRYTEGNFADMIES